MGFEKGQGDIAVIGLAVMGQNLILNMADKGLKVVAYNRTQSKVDAFTKDVSDSNPSIAASIVGASDLFEMVQYLKTPRKVMLMVKAGDVVDQVIQQLRPHLEQGDIIIDGGNSDFSDTDRRHTELLNAKIRYIGMGVSGGEEGARHGPSLMPGGEPEAWPHVKPLFQAIAARTEQGDICCDWVGQGGAGHFVKMVHNGIEYGDMQLIAETYHFMKELLSLDHAEMQGVFADWQQGELSSYLIEITADILGYQEGGEPLLEKILDVAGQKGTGKLTSINAMNTGIPLTLISESVFARFLSSHNELRARAAKAFTSTATNNGELRGESQKWVEMLHDALLASKLISYAQGFMLMRQVSEENQWNLEYGNIALMWRGGCIIRSRFLGDIHQAYVTNPSLEFLGLDTYFQKMLERCLPAWRKVVARSFESGLPMPCMASALSFFDGLKTEHSSANMIQAQRDYFGAHTYERKDRPRGEFFHTNWTGTGRDTTSSSYNA